MNIEAFWFAVLTQDREKLEGFFHEDATIKWHCTNECFTVEEYIKANCDYPGDWDGEIERVETKDDLIITIVRVFPKNQSASYHVVSFLCVLNRKIQSLDEYWSDDGDAPSWRKELNIGKPII